MIFSKNVMPGIFVSAIFLCITYSPVFADVKLCDRSIRGVVTDVDESALLHLSNISGVRNYPGDEPYVIKVANLRINPEPLRVIALRREVWCCYEGSTADYSTAICFIDLRRLPGLDVSTFSDKISDIAVSLGIGSLE